ncbi:UDP-4-amino-4,6-dideoxy-N-acetyl-beta-L-altrosamine N-acetyltransferase [Gracilibacillus oryzae]|uniref:UDP-4-amino-4, 6-dideoxy-N-acetyl-beta-L-altrosamine N-acetyltransferase n=1 Tax=Gracilibacillus oryzae TaxID=1672701 RepID=A0A7C8KTR8_9BACI|nr:UDP-4-amino-4,6-dideoxy-N-acetyl-beta-L-altrosamine N-acetyltransferase [Gracilibacillus oryzae]KAB8135353.1 UDP-4-amino-4,6-dideoxy-N-acetyl-beta-L-altrosamine N-acetyltransferase [Gracilibacillus oryzae]
MMELRELTEEYLPIVLQWRNSDHVRFVMYNQDKISWEEHQSWFERISNNPAHRVFLYFAEQKPLGLVQISEINKNHKRCYWGFYIGEKDAPKGSGTKMGQLAIDKMFSDLQMNKICAEVMETNKISLAYHKKLGFEREGLFKQHIKNGDSYLNVVTMALLRENWKG